MALTVTKLRLSWIVLSAVFISLSVSAVTDEQGEGHRCYWCGPLAEQVHRSQRASKCNGERSKVTVCDEDLPYCAIVATSPPYVESRFCVKFYQDECYSLYCNSTKTWKITCPCRGELCNGINTNRENEAFDVLLKHNVAKLNSRIKRALISSSGFIGMSMRKKVDNATVEENKENLNETSANIVTDDEADKTSEVDNNLITTSDAKPNDEDNAQTVAEPEAVLNDAVETTKAAVIETAATEATSKESDESKATDTQDPDKVANVNNTLIEVTINNNEPNNIQIDIPSGSIDTEDLKTEIIVLSSEIPKLAEEVKPNDMTTKVMESVPTVPTTAAETKPTVEVKVTPEATTEMVKTTLAEAKIDKTKSKSSEKLPAAEALQHNETPTTKTTEPMSTSTTTIMANTHMDIATQAPLPRNSTAVRNHAHIFIGCTTVVFGIILQN
ncbi:uncharacterized protein LOC142982253 [Anticarsia gemmatalis]|uniref:uncharacterized protein LOC142982253 n=1 Tax=Anticarsia gemmatalis TaxID=129554 RepID=UPI003F763CAB